MHVRSLLTLSLAAAVALSAPAVAGGQGPRHHHHQPPQHYHHHPLPQPNARPGAAYTMSNDPRGNAVLTFFRAPRGRLVPTGVVPTGGMGTGAGLGNQGGVVLTEDGRWLLVVNAGSNQITVFAVLPFGLHRTDLADSGGVQPISLTVHGRIVYVLNAGGGANDTDNITGFQLSRAGTLVALHGSTRPLSAASTGPAQVGFSPDGRALVVTEKATDLIDVFPVMANARPGPRRSFPSAGPTPFGFSFARDDLLLVSEAAGGAAEASTVSSYRLSRGMLTTISASVPTTETAACWLVTTRNGRYAYTTNTGSASVSGFAITPRGLLALLEPGGQSGLTGQGPLDAAFSRGDRFLYTLNAKDGTISAFRVRHNGDLDAIAATGNLPPGLDGLAVR